ncbi:YbfB/YjiJ family MFS transporter [Sulfurimonas sp. SAG-AH-194-C20]|nr:YbfB/YjiJ family MFS transporter [Sulfurimonas sp. SAG-AH-194-C20]MDF1878487.1 YbfB/YjiJ family MFS transporter [Sulfurimonas sp. SAG-AH-194-C20]
MFSLLNKNSNANILLAGILAIIIGVGVARFAFTSLLPSMLEDYLTVTQAGVLASLNFVGYLSGALFSVSLKNIQKKVFYFRLGIVLSIVTSLILGTTQNEIMWIISRIFAGFGSAMILLVGASLVMLKLDLENKTKAMGIHFSGIGFAIVISELVSQEVLENNSWSDAWLVLSFMAFIFSFYIFHILSFDKETHKEALHKESTKSVFSLYVVLLILAYLTEGVGFVVQGTFLPEIVNSLEGLEGRGNLAWLIVGVAGIPSSILWMRLAHRFNSVDVIIFALSLQVIGILLPTLSSNIYINLLSAALYGSTFIGLVALFMNLAGQISKHNPVILMGSMTAAYGIGQVVAPLYSVALVAKYGDFHTTLYLTAFIVFIGVVLMLFTKSLKPA